MHSDRRSREIVARLIAVALAGLGLTACDGAKVADEFHPTLTDPSRRHPIEVVADTVSLDLAQLPDGGHRGAMAELELMRFMQKYRQESNSPITLWVPPHGSAHRTAGARIKQVRQVAAQAGVAPGTLRIRETGARGHGILLSYERIAAIGPVCGDWSEDVGINRQLVPYPNFGCAAQRNLAAMVVRPTDFVFPSPEVPRGGERRANDYRTFTKSAPAANSGASAAAAPAAAAATPTAAP